MRVNKKNRREHNLKLKKEKEIENEIKKQELENDIKQKQEKVIETNENSNTNFLAETNLDEERIQKEEKISWYKKISIDYWVEKYANKLKEKINFEQKEIYFYFWKRLIWLIINSIGFILALTSCIISFVFIGLNMSNFTLPLMITTICACLFVFLVLIGFFTEQFAKVNYHFCFWIKKILSKMVTKNLREFYINDTRVGIFVLREKSIHTLFIEFSYEKSLQKKGYSIIPCLKLEQSFFKKEYEKLQDINTDIKTDYEEWYSI